MYIRIHSVLDTADEYIWSINIRLCSSTSIHHGIFAAVAVHIPAFRSHSLILWLWNCSFCRLSHCDMISFTRNIKIMLFMHSECVCVCVRACVCWAWNFFIPFFPSFSFRFGFFFLLLLLIWLERNFPPQNNNNNLNEINRHMRCKPFYFTAN